MMPLAAIGDAQGPSSAQSTGSMGTGHVQLPPAPIFRPVGKAMGISLFSQPISPSLGFATAPVDHSVAPTSSVPMVTSTLIGCGGHPSLPVSIPVGSARGGRTGFLTDPIRVSKSLVDAMASLGSGDDTEVDGEIKQITGNVSHKHMPQAGKKWPHEPSEEDEFNGDSSTSEDLDTIMDLAATKKASKVKSPTKLASHTNNWTDMNLDSVFQDRYSQDLAG